MEAGVTTHQPFRVRTGRGAPRSQRAPGAPLRPPHKLPLWVLGLPSAGQRPLLWLLSVPWGLSESPKKQAFIFKKRALRLRMQKKKERSYGKESVTWPVRSRCTAPGLSSPGLLFWWRLSEHHLVFLFWNLLFWWRLSEHHLVFLFWKFPGRTDVLAWELGLTIVVLQILSDVRPPKDHR